MNWRKAIEQGDLDELIRCVDQLCDAAGDRSRATGAANAGPFEEIVTLATVARAAHAERGWQLWPAANYAEYRVALDAPPSLSGPVVVEADSRFAFGPLTEVIAQHNTWATLEPHLPPSPARTYIAHERVLRGEDLRIRADEVDDRVLDLPLVRADWEHEIPIATYRWNKAEFPAPAPAASRRGADETNGAVDGIGQNAGSDGDRGIPPRLADPDARPRVAVPDHSEAEPVDDPGVDALLEVVRGWIDGSTGRAAAGCVEGTAGQAIQSLGVPRRLISARSMTLASAAAWLAWAGSSGGAEGRRRGGASGRFAMWWALATVTDLVDDWPLRPGEIADAASELQFWWWDAGEPSTGWQINLAIEDPAHGLAWAIAASDHASTD